MRLVGHERGGGGRDTGEENGEAEKDGAFGGDWEEWEGTGQTYDYCCVPVADLAVVVFA